MAQGELHAEREAADLGPELAPARAGRLDLAELPEHAGRVAGVDEHRGDHHGPAVRRRDLLEPRHGGRHALGQHEHAAADLAEGAGQREHLALVGEARGHGHAVLAVVLLEGRGGEADGAGAQRLHHDAPHLARSPPRWRPLAGLVAEHVGAHRGVAHERGHVGHQPAPLQRGQVLGIGLEVPVDARRIASSDMPSTWVRLRTMRSRCGGTARRDREAAVADHHRGDPERRARASRRDPR